MSNVPMTNPDGALAIIEENYGHSSTYLELENGDILHGALLLWRKSKDGGLTWSEPFRCHDTDGEGVPALGLVKLSGAGIGSACHSRWDKEDKRVCHGQIFFWRSEDDGKTWQPPVPVTPPGAEHGVTYHMLQDVALRTSSGRIIVPTHIGFGQKVVAGAQPGIRKGSYYIDPQIPFPGTLFNNQFITTDAHYTDPTFGASTVFYSDDDGRTWQQTRSGYQVINHEYGGPHDGT